MCENTVDKMLSGKSIARALRGLFLTESTLTTEIQELLLPDNVIDQEDIDCIQNEISKIVEILLSNTLIQTK